MKTSAPLKDVNMIIINSNQSARLQKGVKNNHTRNCPYCNGFNIIKQGRRYNKKRSVQTYTCKDCKRKFTKKDIKHRMRHDEGFIIRMISYALLGFPLTKIEKDFNISRQTVYRWMDKYLPKEAKRQLKELASRVRI